MKKLLKGFFVVLVVSFVGFINQQTNASELKSENSSSPRVAQISACYKGILKLNVKLGQQVKKGQLLFEQDTEELEIIKQYDEEALKIDKGFVEKGKDLFSKKSISKDLYSKLESNYAVSLNTLKSTLATISASKYYAPFDGTVTKIVSYDGSAFNDGDVEMEISEGNVNVDTKNQVGIVCSRWKGIVDLNVTLGEKVKKGQLLFKINTDVLEAQLKIDEAKLQYAKGLYERNTALNVRSVAPYDYEKSYVEYYNASKALVNDKIEIKHAYQYAPFDGTITTIVRYSGSGVGECKPILSITASEQQDISKVI